MNTQETNTPIIFDNSVTMLSREIAELCDKRHDNVMTDCRKLAAFYSKSYSPEKSGELMQSTTYTDSTGRTLPCFSLSKQASLDLVTGYSLPHRHAVNKRWMELEQKPTIDPMTALSDPATMRSLLLGYTEKVLVLEEQVKLISPKAQALDRIATQSEGSLNITCASKTLQIQPKKLFAWLQEHHWIYRRSGGKSWIAYQDKLQKGYLEHKVTTITRGDGTEKITEQVLVTAKGLTRLSAIFTSASNDEVAA